MLYIRASSLLASATEHARTYYHYTGDEMGSTTHIVDGEGAAQNRYAYDAWGNVTAQTEAVPNRFKFNGQQLDPISQQYYLRARFYNPVIARFTQEDTYRGDGLNLYAYCANNPVYYVDPTGNICEAAYQRLQDRIKQGERLGSRAQADYDAYTRYQERLARIASGELPNPYNFNDAQLRASMQAIRDAGYDPLDPRNRASQNPMTATILPDGTVVLSANNRLPNPGAREEAARQFGQGVLFVGGGERSNLLPENNRGNTENLNHAESRGVQYVISNSADPKTDLSGAKQATTKDSCRDCLKTQGIYNIDNRTNPPNR